MIEVKTKYVGWGLVLGALAVAAVAFPMIAETANAQRESAVWKKRATTIDTIDVSYDSSGLAAKLAELQLNEGLNGHMRDEALTTSLISYTPEDLDTAVSGAKERRCLAEAVYYEARSETRSGQKAVAEVIMNRVASKHFPDSVCGVVYEGSKRRTGCQFSFTCDGSMDKTPKGKAWKRSQDIATLVLTGGVKPFTNRATHYHTTSVTPVWSNNLRMTKQVGSHVFYRFAPRDYTPSTPTIIAVPAP